MIEAKIRGRIDGQALTLAQDVLVADSRDYLTAEFDFSPDWAGLAITAMFSRGEKAYRFLLNENGEITKDKHLNLTEGVWECSLYGTAVDGMKITTHPCDVRVRRAGVSDGTEPPEIPPELADQIAAMAQDAKNTAESVERRANEGEFDGEPGGYYTVSASADGEYLVLTWTPSREDMEQLPPQKVKVEIPGVKPEEIAKAVEDYLLANPIEVPVASVNGKTGAVVLTAADVKADPAGTAKRLVDGLVIPNVPEWAMKPQKPTYTASEVGAEKSGAVSAHNVSKRSHEDIRLLISDLTRRIDAFFDSDDQTLDQLSEIVEYIKSNKGLIDSITTGKVNVSDIVDNLTTNVKNRPLSAAMGVELKRLIDNIKSGTMNHAELTGRDAEDQHPMSAITGLETALGNKLDATALPSAIETALAQAKASGAFDGKDGKTPEKGTDYFTSADKQEITQAAAGLVPGAYQDAQEGGYAGTESDFKKGLAQAAGFFKKDTSGWSPVVELDGSKVEWHEKYYWQENGQEVTSPYTTDYFASPKIPIPENCTFSIAGLKGIMFLYDSTGGNGRGIKNFSPSETITFDSNDGRKYLAVNTQISGPWTPQRVKITRTSISQAEIDALPANAQQLKPLYGKKVVAFGDSLFGMFRGPTSAPAFAALSCGATVYNVGFGGCRMSKHPSASYDPFSMYALADAVATGDWSKQDAAAGGPGYFPDQLAILKSLDFSKMDIAIIHYGTNDYNDAVPIDSDENPMDINTICGALRYSINKLQTAFPQLQIYVSLPVYRYWKDGGSTIYAEDKANGKGLHLSDIGAGLSEVARAYNLPIIDGYHGLNINRGNASNYLADGTHHNQLGRQRFGIYIGQCLTAGTDGFGFCGSSAGGVSESKVREIIDSAVNSLAKEAL